MFQEIERRGGMLAVLRDGWVAEQIDAAYEPRARDIARRKASITGVSEFPHIDEQRIDCPAPDVESLRQAATSSLKAMPPNATPTDSRGSAGTITEMIDAADRGATIGELARSSGIHDNAISITPPVARSFAEPFEKLRTASDQWNSIQGRRPRVFLANMGPIAHHTARATFSTGFFAAGGFEVVSNDGFSDADAAVAAFGESKASIAVICSSDKLYPELVPQTASALKQAGARTVVLAGHPGDHEAAWREAGVDRFIFIKCDALATLQELLREEGVLAS